MEWVLLILPQSHLVILVNLCAGAPTYVFICLQRSVYQGVMTNMDIATNQASASKFAKLSLSVLLTYETLCAAQRPFYVTWAGFELIIFLLRLPEATMPDPTFLLVIFFICRM